MRRPTAVLSLSLLTVSLVSCASPKFDDPIPVMTAKEIGPSKREAAERQAEREMPNDPRRIKALQTLVWEPGYPGDQRIYAINELLKIDEAQFRKDVSHRLFMLQNYEVLLYIYKLAVDRHWQDFTPVAVRHYARPIQGITDAKRPERDVIAKLNPDKTVDQVIFETFANADGKARPEEQAAAWDLLNRLNPPEKVIGLVAQAPDTTPLVVDLKAAAADLHVAPTNKEGVLWLSYLRSPARKAWWEQAKTVVAALTPEQREGLELRHLPILMRIDDGVTRKMTRAELSSDVRAKLAGQEHHLLAPDFDGQDKDYPQRFSDWERKLSWGDLVVIRFLFEAVHDRDVVEQFFKQADADFNDESTEYGGALDIDGQGGSAHLIARLYKPEVRISNARFVPPQKMVEELYTGLAHYHFHAQRQHNKEYAGPGRGDLETAGRLNFNFLVLTFIDENRLNVDYYSRGGVVVDLCTIAR